LRRALAAGVLLAGLAAAAGASKAATFEDGQRAYDAGRFEEARSTWAPLAEAGDPEAQAGLGLLYDLGQGVPRDAAKAYSWYKRAADAGLARALFNVAVMHDSGTGVPRDTAQAATWYARAAARGHGRAQYNLALLYAAGDGVPQNIAQAVVWYRAAADGGLAAAAAKLSELETRSAGSSPASGQPAGRLLPVTPVEPVAEGAAAAEGRRLTAELVWIAPPQPRPVRFFVELLAVEPEGWRELYAGYSPQSAVLVPLDPAVTRYAWRAYTVAEDDDHYVVGDWIRFTVGSPG
jgi:TPR repeat protein